MLLYLNVFSLITYNNDIKSHWVKKMFAMKLSVEAGKMLVF